MSAVNLGGLGNIFGGMGPAFAAGIVTQIGVGLQHKDANTTGADDEAGRVLVAIAPVIPALFDATVGAKLRYIDAAIAALQNYKATVGSTPQQ